MNLPLGTEVINPPPPFGGIRQMSVVATVAHLSYTAELLYQGSRVTNVTHRRDYWQVPRKAL